VAAWHLRRSEVSTQHPTVKVDNEHHGANQRKRTRNSWRQRRTPANCRAAERTQHTRAAERSDASTVEIRTSRHALRTAARDVLNARPRSVRVQRLHLQQANRKQSEEGLVSESQSKPDRRCGARASN
jgi:hypothetical protein